MGELGPNFEGKGAFLAYDKDGQLLPEDGLRLVVPADRDEGRDVRDVAKIDVR